MRCHRWLRLAYPFALLLASIGPAFDAHGQVNAESDWPAYGNDPGGMRHSALSQINRENVAKLKVAWVFHTGDISDDQDGRKRSGFETTPDVYKRQERSRCGGGRLRVRLNRLLWLPG